MYREPPEPDALDTYSTTQPERIWPELRGGLLRALRWGNTAGCRALAAILWVAIHSVAQTCPLRNSCIYRALGISVWSRVPVRLYGQRYRVRWL